MNATHSTAVPPSPSPSPWSGSEHREQHRWQLDPATDLAEVCGLLTALAEEIRAAHQAGWWLVEPMRDGCLVAARPSRRQRGRERTAVAPPEEGRPSPRRWRLRVVDDPVDIALPSFDSTAADRTPILHSRSDGMRQVGGPALSPGTVAEIARQVVATGLPDARWGVALARVGDNLDLVAHGAPLRAHAVVGGLLVRTGEALTFQHAADGAATLLEAAAAYDDLARTAAEMAAMGGRLTDNDDGLVQVAYDEADPR